MQNIQNKSNRIHIAHGMFSRVDHILGHKTNLYRFRKIEIVSSIFSCHNVMKLEITEKTGETNTWKLNNML